MYCVWLCPQARRRGGVKLVNSNKAAFTSKKHIFLLLNSLMYLQVGCAEESRLPSNFYFFSMFLHPLNWPTTGTGTDRKGGLLFKFLVKAAKENNNRLCKKGLQFTGS
jgi:hypothetical protein